MGSTWFTTLASIRASDPDWEAIACYREPVARFLRRTYPRFPADLAQDVTHEVLCALRTGAVERFDADRGRFRDYLVGVIRHQVRRVAAQRPALSVDPERVADVPPEQVEVVALEAWLLRAVRRAHDHLLAGGAEQREVLYCFADRLLEGLTYPEIAAKENLSEAAVKRRLQAARKGVLRALLELRLEDQGLELAPRRLAKLADAVQRSLAERAPLQPGGLRPWPPRVVALADALVDEIQAGVRWFPGLDSPDGRAFVNALRGILDGPPDSTA